MDKLQLLGIKFKTKLGIYTWEQEKSQILLLNLVIGIDNQAKNTDNLKDTIDYAQLVLCLKERYKAQSFHLLEALAEDIASFLLAEFDILTIELNLIKPGILQDVKEVSIHITREK